jgi:hypothetical protein
VRPHAVIGMAALVASAAFGPAAKTPAPATPTKEQAEAAVKAAAPFVAPKTYGFATGHQGIAFKSFAQEGDPMYQVVQEFGLIKIADDGSGGTMVTLTDKGQRESKNWKTFVPAKAPSPDFRVYELPIGVRHLESVSAPRPAKDGRAEADFRWTWAPNEIGKRFFLPTVPFQGTAVFEQVGGKWKLVEGEAEPGFSSRLTHSVPVPK